MRVYLMTDAVWSLFEGTLDNLAPEFKKRNISIGAWASIGALASIGAWASIGEGARIGEGASIGEGARIGEGASIGEGARIASSYGLLVMGPLGSRQVMMTAYIHKDELWIGTGCYLGEAKNFEKLVKEKHGDNKHARAYADALAFARARFPGKVKA